VAKHKSRRRRRRERSHPNRQRYRYSRLLHLSRLYPWDQFYREELATLRDSLGPSPMPALSQPFKLRNRMFKGSPMPLKRLRKMDGALR
jgi:hypothetical protein